MRAWVGVPTRAGHAAAPHARTRARALRGASTAARMRRIAREPRGPWRKSRAEIEGQHARHSTGVDRRHLNSRRARGCTSGSAAAIGSGEHTVCQCRTAPPAVTHGAIAPPPSERVRMPGAAERAVVRAHSLAHALCALTEAHFVARQLLDRLLGIGHAREVPPNTHVICHHRSRRTPAPVPRGESAPTARWITLTSCGLVDGGSDHPVNFTRLP